MKLKVERIDNHIVLVDESTEILDRDYCYDNLRKVIWRKSQLIKCNGEIYHKIIFAEPELNLDVPVLPNYKEWEVEQLAEKSCEEEFKIKKPSDETLWKKSLWRDGFIKGYNHNKKLYTEEEAIDFYLWARKKYGSIKPIEEGCIVAKTDYKGLFQLYIQSLQKYPKYIIMETELIITQNKPILQHQGSKPEIVPHKFIPKLITNSQGKQEGIIKELIWE